MPRRESRRGASSLFIARCAADNPFIHRLYAYIPNEPPRLDFRIDWRGGSYYRRRDISVGDISYRSRRIRGATCGSFRSSCRSRSARALGCRSGNTASRDSIPSQPPRPCSGRRTRIRRRRGAAEAGNRRFPMLSVAMAHRRYCRRRRLWPSPVPFRR